MISTRSAALALGAFVLPFVLTACPGAGDGATAPKSGVISQITPGSAACQDKGVASVGVLYQPDGKDANGFPWPSTVACVTPEAATTLTAGGRFQE